MSQFYLFTEILNILQTAFSFHLCQFSQGWVFVCEDKQNTYRLLSNVKQLTIRYPTQHLHANYFSSACDSDKMVSPFRSVTVSAISLCLVSSSLMLLMRGASRDNLVLLPLSSSSLLCSSVPLLLTTRRQSLYSLCFFFRYSRKDVLAKSSSADSNLATMHDCAPV